MEPRREEQKPEEPHPELKPKRFRLIKLEERIAPKKTYGCGAGGGGGINLTKKDGSCCCWGTLSIE